MSTNNIHPTAIVEPKAELDGVTVGPYCIIKSGVRIGKGTELVSHVHVEGDTVIGENNKIFPFATIGCAPQDLKYAGEPTRTRVGHRNQIRESVTIHRGTAAGHSETKVGSDCLFMANAHIAHDCVIEDHIILANCASLAGHVHIEPFVILGGLAGVHQFCRIGTRAFLSAGTMVSLDVPPFCIADGRRAGLAGLNSLGLRRSGFTEERLLAVKRAYKEFYEPGRTREEAIAKLEAMKSPDVDVWVKFIKGSTRGVLRPRGHKTQEQD